MTLKVLIRFKSQRKLMIYLQLITCCIYIIFAMIVTSAIIAYNENESVWENILQLRDVVHFEGILIAFLCFLFTLFILTGNETKTFYIWSGIMGLIVTSTLRYIYYFDEVLQLSNSVQTFVFGLICIQIITISLFTLIFLEVKRLDNATTNKPEQFHSLK